MIGMQCAACIGNIPMLLAALTSGGNELCICFSKAAALTSVSASARSEPLPRIFMRMPAILLRFELALPSILHQPGAQVPNRQCSHFPAAGDTFQACHDLLTPYSAGHVSV